MVYGFLIYRKKYLNIFIIISKKVYSIGFEPITYYLEGNCSTNWAKS